MLRKACHGKKNSLCVNVYKNQLPPALILCCHVVALQLNPQAYKLHTRSINTLTHIPAVYLN